MMHALIVGARGAGKSTLIGAVLDALGREVYGFETKKEGLLADAQRGSPVYIYEARKARVQTAENRVGFCKDRRFEAAEEAFDRFAPKLRAAVPSGGIVVMDELGFMESRAEAFCAAVLERLDGEVPVIAAVKDKDTPFLQAVRSHPKARCFFLTEENRDALAGEVLAFMQRQAEEADALSSPEN